MEDIFNRMADICRPEHIEVEYICALCGEHVHNVTYCEERDNDFCDDCI